MRNLKVVIEKLEKEGIEVQVMADGNEQVIIDLFKGRSYKHTLFACLLDNKEDITVFKTVDEVLNQNVLYMDIWDSQRDYYVPYGNEIYNLFKKLCA